MDSIRVTGLIILSAGVILFLFPFLTTNVNPDVSLGFFGLVIAVLGGLVLGANSFRKRVRLRGLGMVIAIAGWTTFAAGALISFVGFLLASQVMCSCPATGPCACFVLLYDFMLYGGFIAALAGIASVVGGMVISRRERLGPEAPTSSHITKRKVGAKALAALAIALTVVIVFGLFSYWPGVYITSVNEQGTFVGGMPPIVDLQHPHAPPFMTSSTSEPASGFQISVGGDLRYTLHFSSIPSYSDYRIDQVSVTSGFSITGINVSLPLVISPSDPSVSVSFTIRGPYYPYYGTLSLFMTIENLNQTAS